MRRSVTKSPGNYFIVSAFYKEIRKHQLQVQTVGNSRRGGGARRQMRGGARPKQLQKSRFARKQPRSKAASRAARRSQGIGAAPSRSGGRGLAQDQSEEGQEFDKRRSSRIDGAETQSGRGRLTRRPARRGGASRGAEVCRCFRGRRTRAERTPAPPAGSTRPTAALGER